MERGGGGGGGGGGARSEKEVNRWGRGGGVGGEEVTIACEIQLQSN